jgi:HTH-type transcriptional regulator / antitoxin HigA
MELRSIRTKRAYRAALKEAETLWHASEGSEEGDRLEVLTLLIQAYETAHYPIPDPDPVEFLMHMMEAREMTRKDLEPYIGSRALRKCLTVSPSDARNDLASFGRPRYSGRSLDSQV